MSEMLFLEICLLLSCRFNVSEVQYQRGAVFEYFFMVELGAVGVDVDSNFRLIVALHVKHPFSNTTLRSKLSQLNLF